MAINGAFHVPHATVADFDGVSIKDFAQDVAFGEFISFSFMIRNSWPTSFCTD